MELTDRFVPRSPDVAWEDFDGEFVVLDLESGRYFSLLDGAALVWRGLTSGHSVETLCAGLPDRDRRRSEVVGLVERLLGYDLLVVSPAPIAEPPRDVVVALAGTSGPFEVDMFDDLADLLLADPVHDVDQETGWPVLRPKQG
jgi:hypothetical protein